MDFLLVRFFLGPKNRTIRGPPVLAFSSAYHKKIRRKSKVHRIHHFVHS